eukprot:COSAG06_NODE_15947_length_1033_cov_1.189507_1_plen_135_part_10
MSTTHTAGPTLEVVCPDGSKAGDTIYLQFDGDEIEVVVPEGISPGDEFEVNYHHAVVAPVEELMAAEAECARLEAAAEDAAEAEAEEEQAQLKLEPASDPGSSGDGDDDEEDSAKNQLILDAMPPIIAAAPAAPA